MEWPEIMPQIEIERSMIRNGGQWKSKKTGKIIGGGLFYHFKRLQSLLWPEKVWHRWNELLLEEFAKNCITGVLGPAASGKTREASDFVLTDYYCFSDQTTVLVSSTEREMLEMRAWGEIKRAHKAAKQRFPWLPGELIESRQRIVTDSKDEETDGRDFRNGIVGVPCKKGGNFVGLGSYAGIHNKRVRLLADEGQFMPAAYVDAISNLKKTTDFKAVVIGNPKDTTDALGKICEPSAELGGWDSGIDQGGITKTWPIRFPDSQCVQLVGSDSPNLDGSLKIGLITQEQINADIQFYGKDSLQFTMMDEGRMPRGQASRRVLTRAMCVKFKAMEPPVWKMPDRTKIGFLDAAYRGVGGDRCVFGQLDMGIGLDEEGKEFHMLALVDTMVVPIKGNITEEPEDQIVNFVVPLCNDRGITPEHMFFDSTGRGSLMGAFARLWSPNVQCVEFGGKPTERVVSNEIRVSCRDYYSKFVSELWFSVRLVIESGQFRGLTEDLLQEGCSREWTMIASNKIEVEPKDKTKIRMGRSPDLFDGLVAGVEGARRLGFVISKLSKGVVNEASEKWKEELRARAAKLAQRGALNYAA